MVIIALKLIVYHLQHTFLRSLTVRHRPSLENGAATNAPPRRHLVKNRPGRLPKLPGSKHRQAGRERGLAHRSEKSWLLATRVICGRTIRSGIRRASSRALRLGGKNGGCRHPSSSHLPDRIRLVPQLLLSFTCAPEDLCQRLKMDETMTHKPNVSRCALQDPPGTHKKKKKTRL